MVKKAWAIALALSASCILAGAAPPQLVQEDDYAKLVGLKSPAISPDGSLAAVVVSRVDWNDDRHRNDLVLVDLADGTQRTLVTDRADLGAAAFSPDGSRIAFLARDPSVENPQTQLFVMALDGTAPHSLTNASGGVDEFAWRPDGRALAYSASDSPPVRTGADRFRDSFIFTTEPITTRAALQPSHLFTVSLDDGATAQLTSGAENASDESWSPDGKMLAFTLAPNAITNDQDFSHIAIVDIATKRVRPLTGRSAWEGAPMFSPDGSHIAYGFSRGDTQVNLTQVYVTTPAGGPGTLLSGAIDRPIGDAVWSHDSQGLIVTAPNGLTNALYRLPLRGAPQRIDIGTVVPGVPSTTTGGANPSPLGNALAANGTLVFIATSTKQPPELFKLTANGAVTKLTDFNDALAGTDWAPAERVTFPTSSGVTADGVLYLPPGFSSGKKYPLVVYIHGGPSDPSMLDFDFWAQAMAARGWLVLRPNYRGSPNLGLKYQRAILYDPEDGPGKDIMSAVNVVRARGIVDDQRIAVCGWSYGGIMTAWMISKYHIWRAAVSGASVNDWITDYGTADDSAADLALLHGSPFVGDNAAEWRRISAISYAGDVTTPVLILSDVGDNRDPFATSSMYWRALRDNHKDATLRVWPVDAHFPSDAVRTVDIYHYWIDYIAEHFR